MKKSKQEVSHVYDLEAVNWTTSLSACCILADGSDFYWYGHDAYRMLALKMMQVKGTWLAHAGGRYDLLLLLQFLPRPQSITVTGSTVLACDFGGGFVIRDSYPAWLSPLKKIGDAVGVPKIDVDRRFMQSLPPDELKRYNFNDCDILRRGDILMRSTFRALQMDHKWTAGSAAMEGLRKLEPVAWREMNNHRIDSMSAVMAKTTAPGGLVDCAFYGRIDNVYCYDVKSSYPARYQEAPMGVGMVPADESDWDNQQANLLVRWTTNKRIVSVAPARSRFTMSGSGLCEAWLTHGERMNLDPYIDRKSVVTGYKPALTMWVGKEFAATMFKYKEKLKIPFAKLWANSAHGKFLEDPIKDKWCRNSELGEYFPGIDMFRETEDIFDGGLCGPHYQPCMAALVYGRARAHLVKSQLQVEAAGGQFLYSDTDSIFTTLPPDKMPMKLGNELGELAFEGGPYSGIFLGPKMYLLHENGKPKKIASKGVPIDRLTRGVVVDGVYQESEASTDDLRLRFFEQVLDSGTARILKDGVRSFVTGAKKADWTDVKKEIRTVRQTWSGRQEVKQGFAPFKHFA